MPITAATLPRPAATEKISTHKTVGTARINATKALMVLETTLFEPVVLDKDHRI
jgi:hypothetical protein